MRNNIRSAVAYHGVSTAPAQVNAPTVSSEAPVIISVSAVTKNYKRGTRSVAALGGVSLAIRQGEFVALTGASGSGKSTLLQLIGGLDKPTSGTVTVDSVDINTLRDSKLAEFRNKTIGFVFQFFYLQPFLRLTVNAELPAMFVPRKDTGRRVQAENLLSLVGLKERMDHYPNELSGGQMQRAAIARALMNSPKILLADEPTGNLDSVSSKEIINLFHRIRTEHGVTVVVVTHNPDIAAGADREIKLGDGVII